MACFHKTANNHLSKVILWSADSIIHFHAFSFTLAHAFDFTSLRGKFYFEMDNLEKKPRMNKLPIHGSFLSTFLGSVYFSQRNGDPTK